MISGTGGEMSSRASPDLRIDTMDPTHLIRALEAHVEPLARAFEAVAPEHLRRRPLPDRWSPIEILGHLLDEERLDFRVRLESTLADPERPWEPIDPEGWVAERDHAGLELEPTLAAWRRERADSVRRLRALEDPDWSLTHKHKELGPLRAGDLLTAWAAHDLQHLRQLANTELSLLRADAEPYVSDYSGPD